MLRARYPESLLYYKVHIASFKAQIFKFGIYIQYSIAFQCIKYYLNVHNVLLYQYFYLHNYRTEDETIRAA
jgi:hypothetical protein